MYLKNLLFILPAFRKKISKSPAEKRAEPVNPGKFSHRQIVLSMIGITLSMFLSALDQTIVGTAMPKIVVDLGGFNQYTWVTTTYIIVVAVSQPIVGKLIDIYGRKIFFIIGLTTFVAASLVCGFSQTMTQLIVFRGFQGLGASIIMANSFIVIADLFPPAERAKYQGYLTGVFTLSSVIGPTLGGFLTDSISWHWVFFVNVPLGIVTIALLVKFFPDIRVRYSKHNIDYAGLSVIILAVVPAMLALQTGGSEYRWASPQIIGLFIFAALMLVLFIFVENRAEEPIIPLTLFKNRIIVISLIANFIISIGLFTPLVFIPLFLQGVQGASATFSGNLLIPMMISSTISSLVIGQILSRGKMQIRTLGLMTFAIVAVGLFLLSRMTVTTGPAAIAFYLFVLGVGLGISMPLYTVAIQNAVNKNMVGVATTSGVFFRAVGGSAGLALLGSLMNSRFASEFLAQLPENIKSIIPEGTISSLAANPRALVNPEAYTQLQQSLSQTGSQGISLFEPVLEGLRVALASSIGEVFLVTSFIMAVGFVIQFWLKNIRL